LIAGVMPFLPLHKLIPEHVNPLKVCGIDEVGRGPWAGPLVACALMFRKDIRLHKLKDSKHLTEDRRNNFFRILEKKSWYGIGVVEVTEIDKMGLIKATNLAFVRALEQMKQRPEFLVIDGRDRLNLPYPFKTIIKGDEKVKIIACASIMAKVFRDRLMEKLSKKYPKYGFESHKGYGTREHQRALNKHGACAIHRKSFAPVHKLLQMKIV